MSRNTETAAQLVAALRRDGIEDPAVLAAIRDVPREEFVPPAARDEAYANRPLPIGRGQTISQPYVVALMTQAAQVDPGSRVLEIGTGSGYQTAVLARLGCTVFSIERQPALAGSAAEVLSRHAPEAHLRTGDGTLGWPEEAPFDAILITAATPQIPEALWAQLAAGGRLVVPEGDTHDVQQLRVYRVDGTGRRSCTELGAVRFVPLIGDAP